MGCPTGPWSLVQASQGLGEEGMKPCGDRRTLEMIWPNLSFQIRGIRVLQSFSGWSELLKMLMAEIGWGPQGSNPSPHASSGECGTCGFQRNQRGPQQEKTRGLRRGSSDACRQNIKATGNQCSSGAVTGTNRKDSDVRGGVRLHVISDKCTPSATSALEIEKTSLA